MSRLGALPTAAIASLTAAAATAAASEIARDHDPDRLHPAGHVENGVEPALGQHVVVFSRTGARGGVTNGLLDAEKLEALVVLVISA